MSEKEKDWIMVTMLQQRYGKQELVVMSVPNPKKRKRRMRDERA
jgi:hypothetical protein